jgi:Ring hydroxylating alpha subunit (catalytic domain)
VPAQERRVEGLLTYVYHLFPNVLITVLSRHTNVVILEPLAIDRTRQITYTLTNGGGDDPEALAEARRDAEFVGTTGAAEDRAVVQAIQRGLGSGANEAFTFGKFESAIVHFHKTLAAALS